jgi:hypothetical protein
LARYVISSYQYGYAVVKDQTDLCRSSSVSIDPVSNERVTGEHIMNESMLLVVDAAINLALGLMLVFFPRSPAEMLGIPIPESAFYASILGAVLTGIGLALLVERFRSAVGVAGLGLGGAISINICGAGVLVVWLIKGDLIMPTRGHVFLWVVAVLVLGVSVLELWVQLKRRESGERA